jgi:DNA gyrase/topoisomerase IV subunit B
MTLGRIVGRLASTTSAQWSGGYQRCSLSCSHESPTDIFVKLMGDVVDPRREFIRDNVLTASVDVSRPLF